MGGTWIFIVLFIIFFIILIIFIIALLKKRRREFRDSPWNGSNVSPNVSPNHCPHSNNPHSCNVCNSRLPIISSAASSTLPPTFPSLPSSLSSSPPRSFIPSNISNLAQANGVAVTPPVNLTYQNVFQLVSPVSAPGAPSGTTTVYNDSPVTNNCGYNITGINLSVASPISTYVRFVSTTGKTGNVQYGDSLQVQFVTSSRMFSICSSIYLPNNTNQVTSTMAPSLSTSTWIIQNAANLSETGTNVQPTDQFGLLAANTTNTYLSYKVQNNVALAAAVSKTNNPVYLIGFSGTT